MSDIELPDLPYPLLCEASGETDLPAAFIAHDEAELRHFLAVEWFGGKPDDQEVSEVLSDLTGHDWKGEGPWSAEFEIGGVSITSVYETAPAILADREKRAQAAQGCKLVPLEPTPEMCRALFVNLAYADDEARVIKAVIAAAPTEASKPVQAEPACKWCQGTGIDGDCGSDGRAIDVPCACLRGNPVQVEAPSDKQIAMAMLAVDDPLAWGKLGAEGGKAMIKQFVAALFATKQAEAPTASNAEREENPIETMERLGFLFALDEETREQADKLASALRGSRVNYQIEQAAADMLWKLSSALATQPTPSNAGEREAPNEIELVISVLRGYPMSAARDDAIRAAHAVRAALAQVPEQVAQDSVERWLRDHDFIEEAESVAARTSGESNHG